MTQEKLDELQGELDGWRGRLDHLRVKANLGKMELRDKLHEVGEALEPAHQRAKKILTETARTGTQEVKTMARSLLAGWEATRRTHRDLWREADRARAARERERRTGS